MASPAMLPAPASTPWERRLDAEWTLLEHMLALNPARLRDASATDNVLRLTLLDTPAPALPFASGSLLRQHALRIVYPRFFPAVPLELYLETPVFHPNVHPETGFVCLWDQHRAANSIEHALHKTVAMLGWRLFNLEARHVMQADGLSGDERQRLAAALDAPPLMGTDLHVAAPTPGAAAFRRRLS